MLPWTILLLQNYAMRIFQMFSWIFIGSYGGPSWIVICIEVFPLVFSWPQECFSADLYNLKAAELIRGFFLYVFLFQLGHIFLAFYGLCMFLLFLYFPLLSLQCSMVDVVIVELCNSWHHCRQTYLSTTPPGFSLIENPPNSSKKSVKF